MSGVREPDYIVVYPNGQTGGVWYDIADTFQGFAPIHGTGPVRMAPTGEFEVRASDGAVAQVWRPASTDYTEDQPHSEDPV